MHHDTSAIVLSIYCRWCNFAKKAMTLRRNEAHLSGTTSAFSSPLPSHHHYNGFSTRTRLRPGGPVPPPMTTSIFDNPEANPSSRNKRNNVASLPSFEEIGMKTMASSSSSSQNNQQGQFLLNRRPYLSYHDESCQ